MYSYHSNTQVKPFSTGCSSLRTNLISNAVAATLLLASLVLFTIPNNAIAQDSGESQVSITVGEAIQITNIDDWVIGIFTATSTINSWQYNWDYQCVYSTSGTYRVELTSQNGYNPLKLVSASGDQMAYEIWSYYRRGNAYRMSGPHSSSTFSLSNLSASQSPTCSDENFGGANLFFAALVRQAPFNQAPAGIYQDLVTLQVIPE